MYKIMSEGVGRFIYRVYGMTIASELELPQLTEVAPKQWSVDDSEDVSIAFGDVPDALPGRERSERWVEVDGSRCLFRFRGIGRFLVEDGRSILIDLQDYALIEDAIGWLVGSVLAVATHQRGIVPLHVSAVLSPTGVVALTGESGAGKSTTAAHLHRSTNWPLISDDVCRVFEQNSVFRVESGVNTIKLWKDALQSLGRTPEGLRRDLTRHDKFHAIDRAKFLTGSHPLKRLIKLEWGESFGITRVVGREAFQIVLGAVYRPEFAAMCGNTNQVVTMAMALTPNIRIYRIVRPTSETVEAGVGQTISALIDLDGPKVGSA